ncbi:hypothetical protein EB796_013878 [Bugula neritina]|uniref:Uncharacterized protein n=1 Tax=Bugula neritina TaxID=10212 RepID=A0A7J7JNA7_BUGNE|nr:hypothetical protein EB796_013878 [Bugula neritina]
MPGYLGSAVAPLINDLPKHITNPTIRKNMISPSVYGVLLIVSGLLAIYLPETNNKALPVSLDSEIRTQKNEHESSMVSLGFESHKL